MDQSFTLKGAFDTEQPPTPPPAEPNKLWDIIFHFATDLNCAADEFIEQYREATHAEVPEHIAQIIATLDNEVINKLYRCG